MNETRILIRLLRMYIPQNWEFGSALLKLWISGGFEHPKPPYGTPLPFSAITVACNHVRASCYLFLPKQMIPFALSLDSDGNKYVVSTSIRAVTKHWGCCGLYALIPVHRVIEDFLYVNGQQLCVFFPPYSPVLRYNTRSWTACLLAWHSSLKWKWAVSGRLICSLKM
jgi:hypothetical protein